MKNGENTKFLRGTKRKHRAKNAYEFHGLEYIVLQDLPGMGHLFSKLPNLQILPGGYPIFKKDL